MKKKLLILCLCLLPACSVLAQTISFSSGTTSISLPTTPPTTALVACNKNGFSVQWNPAPSSFSRINVVDVTNPAYPIIVGSTTGSATVVCYPPDYGEWSTTRKYAANLYNYATGTTTAATNVLTVAVDGVPSAAYLPVNYICPGGSAVIKADISGISLGKWKTMNSSFLDLQWEIESPASSNNYIKFTGGILDAATYYLTTSVPGKYRCRIENLRPGGRCMNYMGPIEVLNTPPLNIFASGGTLLSSSTPAITLDVKPPAAYYGPYANYKWYRNGALVSAVSGPLTVTKKGKYFVTAMNMCGYEVSDTIIIEEDCWPKAFSTFNNDYERGFIFNNNTVLKMSGYVFGGEIIITPGTELTIDASEICMLPCAGITVREDATLKILNGTKLFACSEWAGIKGERNSTIIIDESEIDDANIAVLSEEGAGMLAITRSAFKDNHIAIAVANHPASLNISGNTFDNLDFIPKNCPAKYNIFDPAVDPGFIMMRHVHTGDISNNIFNGSEGYLSGQHAIDGIFTDHLTIKDNQCNDVDTGFNFYDAHHINISANSFNCLTGSDKINRTGIYFNNANTHADNSIGIHNNSFNRNFTGIAGANGNGLSLRENKFYKCYYGINFTAVANYDISGNSFNSGSGVFAKDDFYEPADQNYIRGNTFDSMNYGIVIAPEAFPLSFVANNKMISATNQQIRISCNVISNSSIGIVGCGPLDDQAAAGVSAGNTFDKNRNWDIIWENGGSNIVYNQYVFTPYKTNSGPLSLNPTWVNGVLITPRTNEVSVIAVNSLSGCGNLYKATPVSAVQQKSPLKISPNPADKNFNIEFGNDCYQDQYELAIYDVPGKCVHRSNVIAGPQLLSISCSDWAEGLYIVKLTDNKGQVTIEKMMITR